MDNDVARRRKDAGLTQQQLAEAVSVSRQSIISIERGRFDPTLKVAFRIAQVLGCAIEDAFAPPPDQRTNPDALRS